MAIFLPTRKDFKRALTPPKSFARAGCSSLDACQDCFFRVSRQDIDGRKASIGEQTDPLHHRQPVPDVILILWGIAEEAVIVAY